MCQLACTSFHFRLRYSTICFYLSIICNETCELSSTDLYCTYWKLWWKTLYLIYLSHPRGVYYSSKIHCSITTGIFYLILPARTISDAAKRFNGPATHIIYFPHHFSFNKIHWKLIPMSIYIIKKKVCTKMKCGLQNFNTHELSKNNLKDPKQNA